VPKAPHPRLVARSKLERSGRKGGSTPPATPEGWDLDLMQKLINFFGCGRIRLIFLYIYKKSTLKGRPSGEAVDFLVTKIKDLNDKVIPFAPPAVFGFNMLKTRKL